MSIYHDLQENNYSDNSEFYFYIRGHVRNSFNTDQLKNFVNLLKFHFPNIKFIIQTWNLSNCKKSETWRGQWWNANVDNFRSVISKSTIEDYFQDKNITERCLIIDEETIKLVGSTDGKLVKNCPKKGWKNMWYGIYKGLEYLNIKSSNNIIVSFRFDYFLRGESSDIDEEKVIKFIKNNLNTNKIEFIKYKCPGTDNLYLGRCEKIMQLIEKFHFELDDILEKKYKFSFQELLVNIVEETI